MKSGKAEEGRESAKMETAAERRSTGKEKRRRKEKQRQNKIQNQQTMKSGKGEVRIEPKKRNSR